jgi:Double-GTPase 2
MAANRTLEQQIAVFGESGSGKTVMVSSFYGATQEPQYLQKTLFHVLADDIGQGTRLHRNYLGMRDSARLPLPTRFSATSYSFSVRLKDVSDAKALKAKPFDALRLVWHDYPGEWFEQDVSGPEEAQRRVDAFRALLGSDVALLLVDGQRLVDNAGREQGYLKSLLSNFRNGLLSLRGDLLKDGPLVAFPRIWVLALSKSDLLPELDVFALRDLLIDKAGDEIEQLRLVLAGLVEASDALSLGEDFMLLSSASFNAEKIEVAERVGLELLLPLAAVLPFERHVRWAKAMQLPGKVGADLMGRASAIAAVLAGRKEKLPGALGLLLKLVGPSVVEDAAKLAGDRLHQVNAEALAKRDHLTATLTRFRLDLDEGEKEQILLLSRR